MDEQQHVLSRRLPSSELPPNTLARTVAEIDELMIEFERAAAGVNTFRQLADTIAGNSQKKEGSLPVFSCGGTLNGVHAVEICTDLRDVEPAERKYVVLPLLKVQVRSLQSALARLTQKHEELVLRVSSLITPLTAAIDAQAQARTQAQAVGGTPQG